MMQKILFVVMSLALLCGAFGCRSYAIVNGRKVEMLTKEEEARLLAYAKEIALHQSRRLGLTPAEVEMIRSREPVSRIDYVGDRIGRCIYDWDFSTEKTLRITFGGRLLTKEMIVRAQTFHDTCGGEDGNKVRLISR